MLRMEPESERCSHKPTVGDVTTTRSLERGLGGTSPADTSILLVLEPRQFLLSRSPVCVTAPQDTNTCLPLLQGIFLT